MKPSETFKVIRLEFQGLFLTRANVKKTLVVIAGPMIGTSDVTSSRGRTGERSRNNSSPTVVHIDLIPVTISGPSWSTALRFVDSGEAP